MLEDNSTPHTSPFDAICSIDGNGNEYWSARELHKILGYTEWRNFNRVVINRAMKACEENGQAISDHFVRSYKMVTLGSGSKRKTEDVILSRYAAYLVVMNGDPKMPIVAMGQDYFAQRTRHDELRSVEELPEDQLRLLRRSQMSVYNTQLADSARNAGVIRPQDFAIFQDHGYMGLYGGLRENDIHARKNLGAEDKILDYMGSDELAANIFRASQTRQKLERDEVQGKEQANQTHHEVGSEVRKAIRRLGGTMPEELPTPEKGIQQLQREEQKRLEQGPQLPLFEPDKNGENPCHQPEKFGNV
jgi:DNA-damage-inducible protein D